MSTIGLAYCQLLITIKIDSPLKELSDPGAPDWQEEETAPVNTWNPGMEVPPWSTLSVDVLPEDDQTGGEARLLLKLPSQRVLHVNSIHMP